MADGTTVRAPRSSGMSWVPAFRGAYDSELVNLLANQLQPRTVVIDVGAAFGFWAVALGARARAVGAHVIAVEPIGTNAEILRWNVRRNGLQEHITVVETALDVNSGRLAMSVEADCGNAAVASGRGQLHQWIVKDVIARRLDDVLEGVNPAGWRVSGMKLDVEGWEVRVLLGAGQTVVRNRPMILGEFSPWWLRYHGFEECAPFRWASEHTYEVLGCRLRRRHVLTDNSIVNLTRLTRQEERPSGAALWLRPSQPR